MASHQLAIAKASFSAGLLRPDPTSLSRNDIADFHALLNSLVIQCMPINVQKCKYWILENIAQSTVRFTALGKYLTALTNSFIEPNRTDIAPKREPSIKRRRIHILYLINDLLYHAKYQASDASICSKVQPILVSLFGSAASFKDCPKHQQKIADLLQIWYENGYYSKEYIGKLREAVKNASEIGEFSQNEAGSLGEGEKPSTTKSAKSTPFVMPAMHGDPSTQWFDLPAGNLMPVIEPNSTRPINPDMIKPMQFVAGPASEELVIAVKALLEDVHIIYGTDMEKDDQVLWDNDELGQPIVLDEITGDVLEGEGYYGWSQAFCEKMKRRKKGLDKPGRNEDRRSRSRSRSRSSSRGRKRPHSDPESSPEAYRSKQRRRSYSSSRSPSPASTRNGDSRSRSPRRSPSPKRTESRPRESQLPPPPPYNTLPPRPQHHLPPPPPPVQYQQGFNANFPPPPPPPFNGATPPFGIWPPPPLSMNFNQQNQWPIPPPPPGNPPMQYQQQSGMFPPSGPGGYPPNGPGGWQQGGDGRGYNNQNNHNNGWNNGYRGGRNNYRGRGW